MGKTVYSAPALEKGLDVLEFLVWQKERISLTDLATALHKSVSQIFRCVYVLEQRGYVITVNGGIGATTKAFDLSLDSAGTREMLKVALPEMAKLNQLTRQSSYLTVASGRNIVAVATQASPSPVSVDIRKGAHLPVDSAAGYVHFAAGSQAEREIWMAHLLSESPGGDPITFRNAVDQATQLGWAERRNHVYENVLDLACLIAPSPVRAFVLCVPMVRAGDLPDHRTCKRSLLETCSIIGRKLRAVTKVSTSEPQLKIDCSGMPPFQMSVR